MPKFRIYKPHPPPKQGGEGGGGEGCDTVKFGEREGVDGEGKCEGMAVKDVCLLETGN